MDNKKEDNVFYAFIGIVILVLLILVSTILLVRPTGPGKNGDLMTDKEIEVRTLPYGTIQIANTKAATSTPAATTMPTIPQATTPVEATAEIADGESLYAACSACHNTGAAGAPKLGDTAAWKPRIETGFDTLLTNALNGKGNMPPKGGRMDLSNAQIKAIIEYMVRLSQ